ncbi:hypothetical protein BGZ83_008189 [Gryganskiella cystojenkinii]|nr:hypothetical protein BGZ83_008189 [Gryganskiella cystojenkinii]
MSAQLLSTITASDLARMYVHAAHHLHSHQPIRRYVMMKMIMTQAELIQYGRLRAEMPRAPGPSTGAQPRRTGFGTEANKGLSARPKKDGHQSPLDTESELLGVVVEYIVIEEIQLEFKFVQRILESTSSAA